MSFTTVEDRPVPLRMRPDLTWQRQTQQGLAWYIIKDPAALKYLRLREEQFAALQMLDGKNSLGEIVSSLRSRFPAVAISSSRLQAMFTAFYQSGLILSEGDGQATGLLDRSRKKRRRQVGTKFLSLLWIKFPGVDPDPFLNWLVPRTGWLFSFPAVVVGLASIVAALLLIAVQFDQFLGKLAGFQSVFAGGNFAWVMVALALTKCAHELGHAVACKRFGCECHQIGLLLLVFTPCLYCDTSDSWMLRSKWQRAAVGAAGMYVELVIAAICTFIWWNTSPGLLHYLCLSTMAVGSVSTLVFNANPLLRYDGYYILSDLIEVPNLSGKARSAIVGLAERWFFGKEASSPTSHPTQYSIVFALYAVAAPIYRWFVMLVLCWLVVEVLAPYGLRPIAYGLILSSLGGMVLVPLYRMAKYLLTPGRLERMKKARLAIFVLGLLIAVAVIAVVPVPRYVSAIVVTRPCNAERIYVSVPGHLAEIHVRPGDQVEAGESLARLEDSHMQVLMAQSRGRHRRLQEQLRLLQRQATENRTAAERLPELREAMAASQARLDQLESEQEQLRLVSHVEGTVFPPPPKIRPDRGDRQLVGYEGTPFDTENRSAWLNSGDTFCLVGESRKIEAVLLIDQTEIDRVRVGQNVRIRFTALSSRTWTSIIDSVGTDRVEVAPPEVALRTGGVLATERNRSGIEQPVDTIYEVRALIETSADGVPPGLHGYARILVGWEPLGETAWERLVELFRLS
ncbi:HlyD family secretion protein [Stratiformator vulcanicus]|nr:HlyD family secretion protein [Stratiformator vulcanicus]